MDYLDALIAAAVDDGIKKAMTRQRQRWSTFDDERLATALAFKRREQEVLMQRYEAGLIVVKVEGEPSVNSRTSTTTTSTSPVDEPRQFVFSNHHADGKEVHAHHGAQQPSNHAVTGLLFLTIYNRHEIFLHGQTRNYLKVLADWTLTATACIVSSLPLGKNLAAMVVEYSVPDPPLIHWWGKRPRVRVTGGCHFQVYNGGRWISFCAATAQMALDIQSTIRAMCACERVYECWTCGCECVCV